MIDMKIKKIPVPEFFKIETITYGTPIDKLNPDYLYNVTDAPSEQSVHDFYKGFHIRDEGIQLLRSKMSDEEIEMELFRNELNSSIKKPFITFANDNDLKKEIINTTMKYFEKQGVN